MQHINEKDTSKLVFEVERNYLIDYLTLSISNNTEFSHDDFYAFYKADENSENEIEYLFSKLYEDNKFYRLASILKLDPDEFRFTKGSNGYKFAITNDYYYLAFQHSSDNSWGKKTNYVELKGQGCRYFESLDGNWNELITFLFDELIEFNCTRLDLALDDFTGFFKFEELETKMRKGEFVCPALNYNVNIGFTKNDDVGKTLYAGTNTSGQQLCIYDKKLERINKGQQVDVSEWIRYEFRLRQALAKSCLKELKDSTTTLPVFIAERIGGFLDFKDVKNSRIERDETWKKWKRFLNQANKHKVLNQFKIEQTITRKKNWMNKSLGKFLSTLYVVDKQDFLLQLFSLMDNSFSQLNKSHLAIINRHLNDNGEFSLKLDDIKKIKVELPDVTTSNHFENGDIIEMMNNDIYEYKDNYLINTITKEMFESKDWENVHYRDSNLERGIHIYSIFNNGKEMYRSIFPKEVLIEISNTKKEKLKEL